MSISSEELNYLVWRYCQESGLEVSALALQEETRVLEFDEKYNTHVPIGTLVNLVQRGILYASSELLVNEDGEIQEDMLHSPIGLATALRIDEAKHPEISAKGRFRIGNESGTPEVEEPQASERILDEENNCTSPERIEDKTELKDLLELGSVVTAQWSPISPLLVAVGERGSLGRIIEFGNSSTNDDPNEGLKILRSHELKHPFALSAVSGKTSNQVTALQWSPNGEFVATGVENGEIRLWSDEGKLANVFNFHKAPILAIKWDMSSSQFISVDAESIVILWDARGGTVKRVLEPSNTIADAKDPSGTVLGTDIEWVDKDRFVIPGENNTIKVYQVTDSKEVGILLGHKGSINGLQFDNESKMLLSSSEDLSVRVWRGGNSNSSHCFMGHSQSIVAVHWLDSEHIVSASMDGTVRLWSLPLQRLVGMVQFDGVPVFAGTLSPDRQYYAAGLMDGCVKIVHVGDAVRRARAMAHKKSTGCTPEPIPLLETHKAPGENDPVFNLAWSKHNERLLIAYAATDAAVIGLR